MKIKLDENIPTSAKAAGSSFVHDVDTVADEHLVGAEDQDVLAMAKQEGRFLVTLDRGLGDIRTYPPGSHPGIAVIRLDSQDAASVRGAIHRLLAREDLEQFKECVVIVRGDLVRVRRPE